MRQFIRLLLLLFATAVSASDGNPADWKLGLAWRMDIEFMIAALDSDNFEQRQNAEWSLEAIGTKALPQIRGALEKSDSLEVQTRCTRLIENIVIDSQISAALQHKNGLPELIKFVQSSERDSEQGHAFKVYARAISFLRRAAETTAGAQATELQAQAQRLEKRVVGRPLSDRPNSFWLPGSDFYGQITVSSDDDSFLESFDGDFDTDTLAPNGREIISAWSPPE